MGSDQKIKVCHLASGDLWAGAEVQVYTLLSQLQKLTALSVSAIILNQGKLFEKLCDKRIDVHLIDEKKNNFLQIQSKADKHLRAKHMDLLHSHRYKENILAARLKQRGIAPHIVQTIHGSNEPQKGLSRIKSSLSTALNRYYTRKSFDQIITVSEDISKSTKIWFDNRKLCAIHNSVDSERIKTSKNVAELKSELGIEPNRIVIGTAGRLVPVKGYRTLLETASIVSKSYPEVIFLLAGDGPLRDELESTGQEMGLSDNFRFLGFRHDIINLINVFDIFIMSSDNEGIPVVLLEAMSLSKPVVATSVGGIPEVVIDGETGLLVAPGNPIALSGACKTLLENKELRKEFGERGKKRIETSFTVEQQAEQISKVYVDICSREVT